MKFRVTIKKEDGSEVQQVIDAESRFSVYGEVEKDGGKVIRLEEGSGKKLSAWLNITFGTGVKQSELVVITKNMAAMLRAGLSLSRSLTVIEQQTGNKHLRKVVAGLNESIKKGSSFHEALAEYPKVFPGIFIAMAKAGEESGSLADALSTVGIQMDRAQALQRKIKGAMIYPSIVVSAIIIVAVLMLMFVVPTLTKTFTSLKVDIPLATKIIVALSDFMAAHVVTVLALLTAFFVGGYFFIRSRQGSRIVLWIGLHTPVVGELVRETFAARAARTLSSLLSSSVPVLQALAITKEVVHAEVFAAVITEAEMRVKKGDPLSTAFIDHSNLYPVLLGAMLSVGEETGEVAQMLKQIAEFYEEDVSEKTKDLSTIIEPVLMLLIGAFVGIFAVSMIAPIYSLSSSL